MDNNSTGNNNMDRNQLEKAKYEKAWQHEAYRRYAPGERIAREYIKQCRPKKAKIIDFGAGTGRASLYFHKRGWDVSMIDIADNCLDEEVQQELGHRLLVANLWQPLDLPKAEEGFCTDVMEHIPLEHVGQVIENCMRLCDRVFFHICLREDHFGKELDEHLHLTVRPFVWWRDLISQYGKITDGRDLIENGWFYVSQG